MYVFKTFDPHVFSLLKDIRHGYAPIGDTSQDHLWPEEEVDARNYERKRLRAAYRKHFYNQFQTAADMEAYIAEKAAGKDYNIETLMAREATKAHENRKALPYGGIMLESGIAFGRFGSLSKGLNNFTASDDRMVNCVVYSFERTKTAFNICLVDHWDNSVRTDAAQIATELWLKHAGFGMFFRKPMNLFVHTPLEDRPAEEDAPDRLVQIMENGRLLAEPVQHQSLPPALDQVLRQWGASQHYSNTDPQPNIERSAQQAGYRDFALSNHPDLMYM